MRFEKPLILCIGCEEELTDERLSSMIHDALLDDFLPKKLVRGSTIKVTINIDFSIPDYDLY